MTEHRPLLLIDVDGPLNAFGAPYSGQSTPDGYVLHRLHNHSFTDPDGWPLQQGGERVWLNTDHGAMLLAVAGLVELTWCTAWRDDANRYIAPAIGLPELPVCPLPDGWVTLTDCIWKLPGVEEYAAGRPFAWFDDEFTDADTEWAEKRTAGGVATLLVRIDPLHGLRRGDVAAVVRWAREIQSD